MTPREDRTQAADRPQARVLVERSTALLTAADLLIDDADPAHHSAAAAVAVIAGIAAADALCATALGRRSRGRDHRSAVDLLRQAVPDDPRLADALGGLLDVKDKAHYGVTLVKHDDALRAVRGAHALLAAALSALRS